MYLELRTSEFDNESIFMKLVIADFIFHLFMCHLGVDGGGDDDLTKKSNLSSAFGRSYLSKLELFFDERSLSKMNVVSTIAD